MTSHLTWRRRGSYGLDAPYLLPIPAFAVAGSVVLAVLTRSWGPLVSGAILSASAFLGLHGSLRGKFVVWARLLDELGLRGDERVLDLGCGRGAVLLAGEAFTLFDRRRPATVLGM